MACGPELSEFGGFKAAHEVIYQGTRGWVLIPLKNKVTGALVHRQGNPISLLLEKIRRFSRREFGHKTLTYYLKMKRTPWFGGQIRGNSSIFRLSGNLAGRDSLQPLSTAT
jgi:hypothetical protein